MANVQELIDGVPMSADPVAHEEAIESFFKVVRYWHDHARMTDIRIQACEPPKTIEDFIGAGVDMLWNFVVVPDEVHTVNEVEEVENPVNMKGKL